MAKVHPTAEVATPTTTTRAAADQEPPTVLTVWCKSLLFNCDGFTVYDTRGSSPSASTATPPPAGGARWCSWTPLLTVRRKRLSLAESWVIYDGADLASSSRPPLLSVRRHVGLHSSGGKTLAHVVTPNATSEAFVVEGSYGRAYM